MNARGHIERAFVVVLPSIMFVFKACGLLGVASKQIKSFVNELKLLRLAGIAS